MIVMPANNSKWQVHFWQGLYGGLAHLHSPGGKATLYDDLPFALDNGAYPAYCKQKAWDEDAYWKMLDHIKASGRHPTWALVPDVVANKEETIKRWSLYESRLRSYWNLPLCLSFAVQDGMRPEDVPSGAQVVFVGGTTDWKWQTVADWCKHFPRVHVGRVNGYKGLRICAEAGAESCDGTGWFRGDKEQLAGLQRFLREQYEDGVSCPTDCGIAPTKRKAKPEPAQQGEQWLPPQCRQETLFDNMASEATC
jgi:hypothetical protein